MSVGIIASNTIRKSNSEATKKLQTLPFRVTEFFLKNCLHCAKPYFHTSIASFCKHFFFAKAEIGGNLRPLFTDTILCNRSDKMKFTVQTVINPTI